MNMMKKMVLGAVVLPLSLASTSAFAFGGGHHEGGMKGEGMHGGKCMMKANKKAFKDLNLTDAQEDKFDEIRDARKAEMKAKRGEHRQPTAEMKADHQAMQDLMLADNFDEQAVRDLAEKMSQRQIDRRVEMMKKRHEMMNILTPEQKAEFKANQDKYIADCAS
ncbi:CpxP family protein [Aliivibrio fischeri]|uniref:CpxP family protein n=1 Tax=Aliivibrio fischeri TaxID=668 RepID=UPI00080EE4CD|nr:CpxP family protein [Aliivibrio fischeri]OCH47331.1 P pilus assembly/Cpx signaling pathway inhibitor/zinc-resistance associated protein [Aliivibrio fischeri]OED56734.1 P pilus assembly/Cpx signaling pathway inhibitor/zinc-resistance associated protein [Aliivibrio fischeri]